MSELRSLITHPHHASSRRVDIEDIENPLIAVPAFFPSKGLRLTEAPGVNRVDHPLQCNTIPIDHSFHF